MPNVENIKITNKHGVELSFELVTQYMDNEIREYLHGELSPCSPQFFYIMYCKMHNTVKGEEFITERENIVW